MRTGKTLELVEIRSRFAKDEVGVIEKPVYLPRSGLNRSEGEIETLYSKPRLSGCLYPQDLTDLDRSMCDCSGNGCIRALAAVENLEKRSRGAMISRD